MIAFIIIVLGVLVLVGAGFWSSNRMPRRQAKAMDVLARIVAQNQAPRPPTPTVQPGHPRAFDNESLTQPVPTAAIPIEVQPLPLAPPTAMTRMTQPVPVIQPATLPLLAHPVPPPPPALGQRAGRSTDVLFIDDLHPTERQPVLGRAMAPSPTPTPAVAPPWWSEIRFPKETVAVLAAVCVFAGAGMAAILGTSGPVHRGVSSASSVLPRIPSTLAPSARPPVTTPPPAATQPPPSSLAPPTTAAPKRVSPPSTASPSTTTPPPTTAAPTTAPPPPTTAPPPTAAPGGPPIVTAMTPATGGAGQSLTLTGSGFFSSSGHISITFAGAEASAACPTRTTCTVTVPAPGPGPAPGPHAVPVVVTTPTGSSSPMTFTYA